MREVDVRLAVGSPPRHLMMRVLSEGASIVAVGLAAGAAAGYVLAGVASSYLANVRFPGALPVLAAATVLAVAAVVASLMPAARAARGCPAGAPIGVMHVKCDWTTFAPLPTDSAGRSKSYYVRLRTAARAISTSSSVFRMLGVSRACILAYGVTVAMIR
jgi:hypothetical protein